jgi:hypothetical protein
MRQRTGVSQSCVYIADIGDQPQASLCNLSVRKSLEYPNGLLASTQFDFASAKHLGT